MDYILVIATVPCKFLSLGEKRILNLTFDSESH